MEDPNNPTAQQHARIAKLLSLDVQDFTTIVDQLRVAGDQATPSLQKLIHQLDEKAIQFASENWKEQAEATKATLSNEKINFEQRLQQNEAKINAFKSQLIATRQKLQEKTKEAQDAVTKATELESRITTQQSGSLHTGVELEALKARAETLEVEKREALAALERKVTEADQLNEDYRRLLSNYQEIKKEASQNETEAREAKSSEMSQKLQQQALKQELDMLKQRLEWTKSELDAKSTEFSTYRNEKSTQILKLQGELDQARLDATASAQSNTILQKRLTEHQEKLEETLQKNKEFQDKILVQEEQFRGEMETQRRLAELFQRSSKDATDRVADIEQNMLELQEALTRNEINYKENINEASLNLKKASKAVAEAKVQLTLDLEKAKQEIEQLKAELKRADELLDKAGLTDTSSDIGRYSRYMDLQTEYTALKTENTSLRESMANIVQELAEGAPLIQEQQLECQRLKRHAEELAVQLEAAMLEKDQIAHGAREVLARLDSLTKERDDFAKENHDLDRQVHNLLWRLKAPNAPQSLAPESTRSVHAPDATDAERIIEDRFVLFSDIQDMQKQNKKLREVVRQLTKERTDAEQEKQRARTEEEQNIIQEAKQQIESMREEIGSKDLQIATYKQETEMLRRTLKASNIRYATSTSLTSDKDGDSPSTANSNTSTDSVQTSEALEYAKLLSELQKTFDAYRSETSIDTKYLKEQLSQVQSENSECRIKLGRAQAQVELLEQRYQLAVENNNHQTTEMSELRKRCSFLQDAATRHEIANQRLSSDLYTERDTASRLSSEISNLKQEQALWKGLESRMREENESLVKEKSHLSSLLLSVQNMANDAERGSEQAKRRLEAAVTSKEQEVETLREKIKEEVEASKRMRDRKGIESKEWQSRIDALTSQYQAARESLIEAKTSLEYANAKVDDLTKQLKSREDQLAIYQQKPAGSDASVATPEEKLQAQVSQLRAELARQQAEADANCEHVAQFQAISQTNEDRLAEMTTAFDAFRKEHDEAIAQSSETIKNLEAKLAAAEERARTAATNLIEAQNKADADRNEWKAEKTRLEERIRSLEQMESQMKEIEAQYRNDILVHSNAAQTAHENYQRELLNHARDMETLSKLKEAHTQQAQELSKFKANAETAIANLQSAEISWESQKNVLQKSLSEVEKRCTELKDQNEKLHQHLEDVNAKAMTIQRLNAPSSVNVESVEGGASEAEGLVKGSTEHQLAELRDVIRYVRREKEILECQHELNLQESRRLKQQVDETTRSLEETRALLTKERAKQQDAMISKEKHEEILEKINQINLLRESNAMLRSENESLQKRVVELETSNRELQSRLEPLNQRVREMIVDLETSKEELKQLGEDRDRWRTRTHDIMAKHDRIDPTEFQELKDLVEKYKAEAVEHTATAATAKEESAAAQVKLQEMVVRANKMASHASAWRKRHTEEAAKLAELQKELETVKARVPELEKSLEEATSKGNSNNAAVQREKENIQKTLEAVTKTRDTLAAEKAALEANMEAFKSKMTISVERNRQLNRRLKEAEAKLASGGAGVAGPDSQAAIAAAVNEKTAELEKKHAEEKAALEKAIAEQAGNANASASADAAAKIAELTRQANAHTMAEMRSKIMIQTKEKEIQSLKSRLAMLSSAGADAGIPTGPAADATAPSKGLSVNAPAFSPSNGTPGRPPMRVRPTGPTAAMGTAPAPSTAASGPGVRPRPGVHAPGQPGLGAGQNRLRPPLSARNAASTTPVATSSAPTPNPTPAAQTPTTTSPAATPPLGTATPSPTLPASPALTANPSRGRMIKRRREDELPSNIPQASASQDSGAPGSPALPSTPTMPETTFATNVTDTSATKSPSIIKRQRQLPVVGQTATGSIQRTQTTTTMVAGSSPTAGSPSGITESPGQTMTTTSTIAAATSTTTTTVSSTPHGQKRRLEATETVQESITIVSTPNPADLEDMEETPATENGDEATAMDVDDVPPVKRIRPTSEVVITEVADEPSVSPVAELPATPGALDEDEDEEGALQEENANQGETGAGAGSAGAQEESEVADETAAQGEAETVNDTVEATGPEDAGSMATEAEEPAANTAANATTSTGTDEELAAADEEGEEGETGEGDGIENTHEPVREDELGAVTDGGYGTPDAMLAEEDYEVQTPPALGHEEDDVEVEDEETGDLELEGDGSNGQGREHDMEGRSESTA
ncbi:hypothetical protein BGZ94_008065 [Podila epigama]|nr:hypothetical protein BGZ94_008065 [Podila epigama]